MSRGTRDVHRLVSDAAKPLYFASITIDADPDPEREGYVRAKITDDRGNAAIFTCRSNDALRVAAEYLATIWKAAS